MKSNQINPSAAISSIFLYWFIWFLLKKMEANWMKWEIEKKKKEKWKSESVINWIPPINQLSRVVMKYRRLSAIWFKWLLCSESIASFKETKTNLWYIFVWSIHYGVAS